MTAGDRRWVVLVALALVAGVGCKDRKLKPDDDENKQQETKKKEKKEPEVEPNPDEPATVGLVTVETDKSVEEVATSIQKQFDEDGGISVSMNVDHAKNAESADMKLPPTRLIAYGYPQLDMPFVAQAKSIGLDFPQKLLVWGTSDGKTRVTFNAPAYAAKRHGLEKFGLQLGQQEEKLSSTIKEATGTEVPEIPKREAIGVDAGQGVVTLESNNSVSDTFEKLQGWVEENESVSAMASVDYQKRSEREGVDAELTPAKLLVVGNPNLGTPLMKESRTIAVDLPQKIYVYGTKQGAIRVAYNDPKYLAMRHGLDEESEQIGTISEALESMAEEACKEME